MCDGRRSRSAHKVISDPLRGGSQSSRVFVVVVMAC